MFYVEGLKNNLLSVSQMCNNGYDVSFRSKDYEICNMKNIKLVGKQIRTDKNVYVFDDSRINCYLRKTNEARLWHKRLGHMNFDSLIKAIKMGVVRGLPKLSRPDRSIFKSCQFGKLNRIHFSQKSSPHVDHSSSFT